MNENPLVILFVAGLAGYLFNIWLDDYRDFRRGKPNPKALPGATPASLGLILVGVLGSLFLVGVETAGEYALGTVAEQSILPMLFLLAMVVAGIIEEVVFRGYLVVTSKGIKILVGSIVLFSALFALGHVQYWLLWGEDAPNGVLALDLNLASSWTLLLLFLNGLWWYTLRFLPSNTHRSLLPCFAAHIASNLGVFVVKAFQGYIDWSF